MRDKETYMCKKRPTKETFMCEKRPTMFLPACLGQRTFYSWFRARLIKILPVCDANVTATCCNTLQHTATHRDTPQHIHAWSVFDNVSNCVRHPCHCSILQHTATHCSTMQNTVAYCSTLQHAATRCSTLHHTAAHCSIL